MIARLIRAERRKRQSVDRGTVPPDPEYYCRHGLGKSLEAPYRDISVRQGATEYLGKRKCTSDLPGVHCRKEEVRRQSIPAYTRLGTRPLPGMGDTASLLSTEQTGDTIDSLVHD
jgi:hypothetical protein